jgi:hypothetical protein
MPEATLETVLAAITEMRSDFSALRTDLSGRIDKLRVELSERIDRMQNGVTALRQGYIVDLATVDRAERIAKSASDETRALAVQVTELTKLVHMLEARIRDLRGDG